MSHLETLDDVLVLALRLAVPALPGPGGVDAAPGPGGGQVGHPGAVTENDSLHPGHGLLLHLLTLTAVCLLLLQLTGEFIG